MGLQKGVTRQKRLNKIQEIKQKPNEDATEFLERIYQAYRRYTDADPEAPENIRMINMTFIGQSAPDIGKKLQKLDGAFGMNPSQLVDVAFKVFNNREQRQKQEDEKLKSASLAAALNSWKTSNLKEGKPPLKKEQCAYCKEEEHWKRHCPRLKKKKENNKKETGATHVVEREKH